MKQCNLIMVTEENNNKFYNMEDDGNQITVKYGRVGCKETICTYPSSKWESLKNSKLKKGYVEITQLKEAVKANVTTEISDKDVRDIVTILLTKARNVVAENYLVSYKEVTQKQIDEAQVTLNSLLDYKKRKLSLSRSRFFARFFRDANRSSFLSKALTTTTRHKILAIRWQFLAEKQKSSVTKSLRVKRILMWIILRNMIFGFRTEIRKLLRTLILKRE